MPKPIKPTKAEEAIIADWTREVYRTYVGDNCIFQNEDWKSMAIGFLLGRGVSGKRAFALALHMTYTLHVV